MGCQQTVALGWVPGIRLEWDLGGGVGGWGRACGVAHVGLGEDGE